jgi:hypothetical protein
VDVSNGDFRYLYLADYLVDDRGQPSTHTIRLVSNSPNTSETIRLSSAMFNDATVSFTTAP